MYIYIYIYVRAAVYVYIFSCIYVYINIHISTDLCLVYIYMWFACLYLCLSFGLFDRMHIAVFTRVPVFCTLIVFICYLSMLFPWKLRPSSTSRP